MVRQAGSLHKIVDKSPRPAIPLASIERRCPNCSSVLTISRGGRDMCTVCCYLAGHA